VSKKIGTARIPMPEPDAGENELLVAAMDALERSEQERQALERTVANLRR
jgi:hypothetical protein